MKPIGVYAAKVTEHKVGSELLKTYQSSKMSYFLLRSEKCLWALF